MSKKEEKSSTIMDFKNLKKRFNDKARRAGERTREVLGNAYMVGLLGTAYAYAGVMSVKEKFLPSFWTALEDGNVKLVEEKLTKNLALANEKLEDGESSAPLHIAAHYGQVQVAEVLLKHGATLDTEDRRGITPLLIAASRGDLAMIELFLKNNDPTLNRLAFQETETAVMAAAGNGHPEALEMLHKGGARLNVANVSGASAITELQGKIDFQRKNPAFAKDIPALEACMRYLEQHIDEVVAGDGLQTNAYTQLMDVAKNCDEALAKTLLSAASPEVINQRYIAEEPSLRIHGMNEMDHTVTTALKEAIDRGSPALIELFLKHGARQDLDWEGDETPLMVAAKYRKPEILNVLLANDVSTIDSLYLQKYEGMMNPKRVDFTHSALTYAVQSKNADAVRALLDHGARTDLPTTKPPLQLAKEMGLTEIENVLVETELAKKEAERQRLQKTADSFHEGLNEATTAAKPLELKRRNAPKI